MKEISVRCRIVLEVGHVTVYQGKSITRTTLACHASKDMVRCHAACEGQQQAQKVDEHLSTKWIGNRNKAEKRENHPHTHTHSP